MRKLLLASAAVLSATSSLALAQTPTPAPLNMMMQPSQGQMPLPWAQGPTADNNNNSYGVPSTYNGNAKYGANAVPTPGTVVIRLNGKVEADISASWGPLNTSAAGPTTYTTTSATTYAVAAPGGTGAAVVPTTVTTAHAAAGAPAGAAKVNPLGMGVFMRLYPGVDGMAANGVRYGASIELRQNFPGGSAAQTTPAQSPAPNGSSGSSGETVFVRRAFTYLASDNFGLLRLGQADGVIGLFDPGIFSADTWDAGVGNFNGGTLQSFAPNGAVGIPFVWLAQAGAEYGNTKAVYLSPQFAGFDFGLQYAPSMGNAYTACGTGVEAGATCVTATTGSDPTRWYNQLVVGARYQGNFGPVGIGAFGVYETAGKESGNFVQASSLSAGPLTTTTPANTNRRNATNLAYDNLSFFEAAAYASVSSGFGTLTYSIDYIGGALNGQLAMRPKGGAPENGVVTGLTLNNGPITLGVETAFVDSQGNANLTGISQRHEWEVAFGGNYNLAPGIYLVGEYMYTQRHQGEFDFANNAVATGPVSTTGAVGGGNGLSTRDARAQGIMFSTVVNW
jgi:hypothetical protein